jgi:hypothetical protein
VTLACDVSVSVIGGLLVDEVLLGSLNLTLGWIRCDKAKL